jgi:tRNA (guanine-N7-)-methyltransferase
MPKDKLRRFAEFASFSNTFDFAYGMRGCWKSGYFQNENPLVVELGCGKGEYTVALAREYPEKNFIGIDLKSNRMWKGAGIALSEQLTNVAFMRALINKITELFAPGEVDELWITFPDPFPKDRHAKHRLTSPGFLERYKLVLQPGGLISFKTDDDGLFQYTLDTLKELQITPLETEWDVHANEHAHRHLREIRTYYENYFMGKGRTIKFTQFKLN